MLEQIWNTSREQRNAHGDRLMARRALTLATFLLLTTSASAQQAQQEPPAAADAPLPEVEVIQSQQPPKPKPAQQAKAKPKPKPQQQPQPVVQEEFLSRSRHRTWSSSSLNCQILPTDRQRAAERYRARRNPRKRLSIQRRSFRRRLMDLRPPPPMCLRKCWHRTGQPTSTKL